MPCSSLTPAMDWCAPGSCSQVAAKQDSAGNEVANSHVFLISQSYAQAARRTKEQFAVRSQCCVVGSLQLMAPAGCSKWPCTPAVYVHWTAESDRSKSCALDCSRSISEGDRSGTPSSISGVLSARGPPGSNMSNQYSVHDGEAAAYPTTPDPHSLKSCSKNESSSRSILGSRRMSIASAGRPSSDTAELNGLLSPLQMSKKIFVPNVVQHDRNCWSKFCGVEGME